MVCRTAPLHGPPFRKRKNTIIRETGKEKGGFSFISADKFSRTPLPAPFRLYPSCKHPESIYHEYTTDVGSVVYSWWKRFFLLQPGNHRRFGYLQMEVRIIYKQILYISRLNTGFINGVQCQETSVFSLSWYLKDITLFLNRNNIYGIIRSKNVS